MDTGSSPNLGAESSVRIPKPIGYNSDKINFEIDNSSKIQKNSSDKYKLAILFENSQMRDLYNRKKSLNIG